MGHAASKSDTSSSDSDSGDSQRPSRIRRFGQRLRLRPSLRRHCRHARRKKTTSGSHSAKLLSEEDFAGIARLRLVNERKLLLESHGAHIARISVFETNKLSRNNLIGYCEIDLLDYLSWDSNSDIEAFDLLDPSSPSVVVG
nr:phosphatidylserine decarboxylase proenzyme 2-like [Ipomoea trifida]GMD77444.1 phosphatidylserine decarboxylase proenzyme 2-like isoform X1 [Ipomoea batatas]